MVSQASPVLYALHDELIFVVRGQRIRMFSDEFFAKRGLVWCNRPNFPKGGWPGSLAESQRRKSEMTPVPEPYV